LHNSAASASKFLRKFLSPVKRLIDHNAPIHNKKYPAACGALKWLPSGLKSQGKYRDVDASRLTASGRQINHLRPIAASSYPFQKHTLPWKRPAAVNRSEEFREITGREFSHYSPPRAA
jgi:hypothetical protein